ncbi:MAG: site-specific integrase [Candidatus Bathyarchaeales archaeon]
MVSTVYARMLEDEDVKRWYENVARGSRVTADVYLRRLDGACRHLNLKPKDLLEKSDKDLARVLADLVSYLEKEGKAGSYIKSCVKAVKSWLSFNMIEVKAKIKIKDAEDTPTLRDERVPTQQELRKILICGDLRAKCACLLLAHSGLRIETLGNYEGTDGLRVRDLPEIKIEEGEVIFTKVPTMVTVRRELSKGGHQYFTFLSEEGCEYLKDYLESRMKEGETLTPDSPILTPKNVPKPFIRSTNIGDIVRNAIRKAGFKWRPYVLRAYFDTQLMLAESKGLVLRDYRQFWMGHKGDIENRYTTNKNRLPEDVIEDMREAYGRSQEYLQTTVRFKPSEEELKISFRKQLLLVAGFKAEEVDAMDVASMSDEELQQIMRRRLFGENSNDCRQKVVPVKSLENYLNEGWEYVTSLPNGKVIIKLQNK